MCVSGYFFKLEMLATFTSLFSCFLGPRWDGRQAAETALSRFVLDRGGSVSVASLQELYRVKPWLAGVVGNLRSFCAGCSGLQYSPRTPGVAAQLAVHVAFEMAEVGFDDCAGMLLRRTPVQRAAWRPTLAPPTSRRHDGRRYAGHSEAHLASYSRLFAAAEAYSRLLRQRHTSAKRKHS